MNDEKGFSLVEVIAAIVILIIVLTSIYPLFSQSKDMTVRNEERLVAYHAAEAILKRAKTTPNSFFKKHKPLSNLAKEGNVCTTKEEKNTNNQCYILINNNAYEWELTFGNIPLTKADQTDDDQALVQAKVTIKNIHRLQSKNINPNTITEDITSAKTMPLNYSIEAIVDDSLHYIEKQDVARR